MKHKKHKNSFKTLKNKLWKICSQYIHERDKNKCFTCGKHCVGRDCQTGHYIPMALCNFILKYNIDNLHIQCSRCNIWLGGNGARYHIEMVKKYGQEFVDNLWKLNVPVIKWEEEDYKRMIEYYKLKLKEL